MSEQKLFKLENVRISFPDLFEPAVVNGTVGAYGAHFLLTAKEHGDSIDEINKEIAALIKTELKGAKIPADKRCLKDGDNMSRAEYEGYMVLSANAKNQPIVLKPGTRSEAETMQESRIYSGCRVDAQIALWAQNNQYGKRINAQLVAVRFFDDDEAFSGGHVDKDAAVRGFEIDDNDDFLDDGLDEAA